MSLPALVTLRRDPSLERVSWLAQVQDSFYRASTICLVLTLLLLPFPVRLPLVGGFGRQSLTALDAFPADFTALGAIAYGLIAWLLDLRFWIDDLQLQREGDRKTHILSSFLTLKTLNNIVGRNFFKSLIVNRQSSILLWLLVGWAWLSLLWSAEPLYGWLMMARLAGGLALLMVAQSQPEWLRRILALVLVLGGAIEGIIGLWQFARQEVVSLIFWPQLYGPQIDGSSVVQLAPGSDFVIRAYGTLSHPNVLGGYLALAFLAAIWLAFQSDWGGWVRWLSLVSLILISAGLVVSFSRSAWLGLALGLLFLGKDRILARLKPEARRKKLFARPPTKNRKPKLKYSLLIAFYLLLLLGLLVAQAAPLSSRLFRLDLPMEKNSLDERVNYLRSAAQVIGQNPWLGVGLSNYTVYTSEQQPQLGEADRFPVHNVPLLLWGELGLAGILLWLLVLLVVFFRPGPEPIWAAGIIGLAVIAQFDHYPWSQPQAQMLWWLMLGLWLGSLKQRSFLNARKT